LGAALVPCGPVSDKAAAQRIRARLAQDGALAPATAAAWDALAPAFAASPYLARLAVRDPKGLERLLAADPDIRRDDLTREAGACGEARSVAAGQARLRTLKAELHLLTALADLGGLWDLGQVTGALSAFAEAAVASALALAARQACEAGLMIAPPDASLGPAPGLFVIAMGKLGAGELNYSSDIDISIFYTPEALPVASEVEPARLAARLVEGLSEALQAGTAEGYVFRVDLRLRPDPLSTPAAGPVAAALHYYQTVGQNWERMALIKARPLAGDLAAAEAFLGELQPFIWRRHLDFSALADIHAIKRQIHVHKVDERLEAAGANVKLGRGGIREVEFFVQTLQLIHGGRDPGLRARATLSALEALRQAGRVSDAAASELASGYVALRRIEHRLQMIEDEQTHRIPEDKAARGPVAALCGARTVAAFDAATGRLLTRINRRYGELFPDEEPLSAAAGSLVFTGVEDDPETLATLARLGFRQGAQVAATIRGWHHGRIRAMRLARERELFTRLAPRLLEAAAVTGAPDAAFARFADFFEGLAASVQVQSLFLAHPELLVLVVRVMAFAPRFARTLARQPAVLDSLLDARVAADLAGGAEAAAEIAAVGEGPGAFEAAMDAARRVHAERVFRIGARVLNRTATAAAAGAAFADLAEALVSALARAAHAEVVRAVGPLEASSAVIALGSLGAREMNAASDLDLMTLYEAAPDATSRGEGLDAATFHARFTQRLIAALSALTPAGGLYKVDMQLRPSGTAGPVAVSLRAFETYYAGEAETWELQALSRARVVWASTPAFAARAAAALETALRRPRDPGQVARDVREMRALMEAERPAWGDWDLKLRPGGLVDLDFIAQGLELIGAASGGPLQPGTGAALACLAEARPDLAGDLAALSEAWTLETDLLQVLKIALDDGVDPKGEPRGLQALLCEAGGVRSFAALERRLNAAARRTRQTFLRLFDPATEPGHGRR
jgi:glutamate-ammonia-ligase adenylyltransferase